MKKNKILFIPIAILFICLLLFFVKSNNCQGNEYFNNLSFYGVVINKYIDKNQHSIPVIDLLDLNSDSITKVDFFLDTSNSYENINIHDTIIKNKSSMLIYIIKNGKIFFLTKVNFNCQ